MLSLIIKVVVRVFSRSRSRCDVSHGVSIMSYPIGAFMEQVLIICGFHNKSYAFLEIPYKSRGNGFQPNSKSVRCVSCFYPIGAFMEQVFITCGFHNKSYIFLEIP